MAAYRACDGRAVEEIDCRGQHAKLCEALRRTSGGGDGVALRDQERDDATTEDASSAENDDTHKIS